MQPRIVPFQPGHMAALRGLVAEMQEFERGIDPRLLPGSEMTVAYTEGLLARCVDQAGVILVAELGGEVAGFVAVLAKVPNGPCSA